MWPSSLIDMSAGVFRSPKPPMDFGTSVTDVSPLCKVFCYELAGDGGFGFMLNFDEVFVVLASSYDISLVLLASVTFKKTFSGGVTVGLVLNGFRF